MQLKTMKYQSNKLILLALKMLKMKENAGLHLNPFVDLDFMMKTIGIKEHRGI